MWEGSHIGYALSLGPVATWSPTALKIKESENVPYILRVCDVDCVLLT